MTLQIATQCCKCSGIPREVRYKINIETKENNKKYNKNINKKITHNMEKIRQTQSPFL